MAAEFATSDGVVPEESLLIVVGSGLSAEEFDRPLGYRLRERVLDRLDALDLVGEVRPVVCGDLWYLNDETARLRPTVAVGAPESNAATAFLAGRLSTAFVMEGVMRVHFDPEFLDLKVCLWGSGHAATASAVDLFVERYLEELLRAICGLEEGGQSPFTDV